MAGAPKSDWDEIREMLVSFSFEKWLSVLGGLPGFGVSRALFLGILYVGMWSILNIQIPNLFFVHVCVAYRDLAHLAADRPNHRSLLCMGMVCHI